MLLQCCKEDRTDMFAVQLHYRAGSYFIVDAWCGSLTYHVCALIQIYWKIICNEATLKRENVLKHRKSSSYCSNDKLLFNLFVNYRFIAFALYGFSCLITILNINVQS